MAVSKAFSLLMVAAAQSPSIAPVPSPVVRSPSTSSVPPRGARSPAPMSTAMPLPAPATPSPTPADALSPQSPPPAASSPSPSVASPPSDIAPAPRPNGGAVNRVGLAAIAAGFLAVDAKDVVDKLHSREFDGHLLPITEDIYRLLDSLQCRGGPVVLLPPLSYVAVM
ncbi:villin 4 [Striga asiatica]|uniref:Villin 4 n=1 Tax=Striga asiatica TaxID=4170 RepID=A0A5A7QYW4_STRAF|nr:villin 4 [Striga asiatica]